MRKILSICLLLIAVVAQAQIQEPVKFKSELKTLAAGEAEIVFTLLSTRVGMYILPTWVTVVLSRLPSM